MNVSSLKRVGHEPGLSQATIRTSVPEGEFIRSLVVFPQADEFLSSAIPPHIRCVALLRLTDGTIWMLSVPGTMWTDERLGVAAKALLAVSADAYTKSTIEQLLRETLRNEAIRLEQPIIDRVDLRLWDVQKASFHLAKRLVHGKRTNSVGELDYRLRYSDIEKLLIDGLDDALQEFVDELDSTALDLSLTQGRVNHRLYNYLAHKSYREFRVQFAGIFPSLLLTSVLPEKDDLGVDIRSIVDSGAPAIKTLARRWGVRPSVIKHLVGRMSGHVGLRWSRDARGLAQALNALRTEDLPGDVADEWVEFNHMVAVGEQFFRRRIWESAAALEWLRECVHRSRRGSKTAVQVWLPDWDKMPTITRFRDALLSSLRRDVLETASTSRELEVGDIEDVVDPLVVRIASHDLALVASRFSDEVEAARRESVADKVKAGEAIMPLIPREYVSRDGTRIIRPMTTSLQLMFHGLELNNCLASDSQHYMRKGSRGTNFIVGIFDKDSGKPVSTAEISVRRSKGAAKYHFLLKQHTARNNNERSPQCARAIKELLSYCQTDEIRTYLQESWKQIRHHRVVYKRVQQSEIHEILTRALRRTVTDVIYDELLATLRRKTGD